MATEAQRPAGPPPVGHNGAGRPVYIAPEESTLSITEKISKITLRPSHGPIWDASFAFSSLVLMVFLGVVVYLIAVGVGIWGIDIPVAWGFAITSFVWWIGIGHAGTLISAFLLLMHQKWRTSINRLAEAMTIFAVMSAGVFPLLHLGRPWFFFWLFPYTSTLGLWPQFRSALIWDVFAVSTYFLVSLIFWYVGMIPDLATLRDRAKTKFSRVGYGLLALGWRNSARHWQVYQAAYLLLAGLATPLVVSVHSVVSSDFAMSNLPGWHETVFPPYFVAGAIFSGFAMVLVLAILLRKLYHLESYITVDHLEVMAKVLLATSFLTSYGYMSEQFMSWYGNETVERYVYTNRLIGWGQYATITWIIVFCNVVAPQIMWWKQARRNQVWLMVISLIVLIGMWLERYMIITTSLHRDFLPSSWGMFRPTIWDFLTYFGSIGLFLVLFLLFCRFLPLISMSELRAMTPGAAPPRGGPMKPPTATFGLLAEFATPEDLLKATRAVRREGYRVIDAYTPYTVRGLSTALGMSHTPMPFIVLAGGITGVCSGFFMQWWTMSIDYPFNVGGRPGNSWPVFLPIAFEVMVLIASLSALFGMLYLNGLPRLNHPIFNVPRFTEASQTGFFLSIEAIDPLFDAERTRTFLAGLNSTDILEIPYEGP